VVSRGKVEYNGALEFGIFGFVIRTNTATAKFLEKLALGDRLTDHDGRISV